MSILSVVEIFGEVLLFLNHNDLLKCELLCCLVYRLIQQRRIWRILFEEKVSTHFWCLPKEEDGICWKTLYYKYKKEVDEVRISLLRNTLSARFIWRCLRLWNHLSQPLDRHRSPAFELSSIDGKPLKWKILLQKLVRDNQEHLGIFLQQKYHPVRCFFSLSVLDSNYNPVLTHSCPKAFPGGRELDASTCGWLFSREALKPLIDDSRQELLVQLDLTVFPNTLDSIKPLFELISDNTTTDDLRRTTISSIGDFVTHFTSNTTKAKQYLQEINGGPLPLINILDDQLAKSSLRSAAAGALWNILDTSTIYMKPELIQRMVQAACWSLHCVFAKRPVTIVEDPNLAHVFGMISTDSPSYRNEVVMDEDLDNDRGVQEPLVTSLTGLMWNIPIIHEFRIMMATNPYFFPSLFRILMDDEFSRAHFTCLHLISTLHKYNHLPKELVPTFRTFLYRYISTKDSMTDLTPTDVGVLLSLRDVADFFIPLLLSRHVECVAFGSWCMDLFYFKTHPLQ
eukprot:NODE_1937_length_1745_cov_98.948829_g1649_i0.p1 GENE.NODE_1937_length_1745_cov_98.948829_g1649_i0~~NODE_1937_length_1745_cov_98.948829_g1649_i0.p1  ORF type:complete len:511 (-),score=37.01 NODE_1937_length_1745_cov_98.948829_g1649_i0:146-1678(-)